MIEGHVAAILDDYHVVMDKGYKDGVRSRMNFILYDYGDEIKDPITGEVLDREIKTKYTLSTSHVQEKMTTLYSTDRTFGWLGSVQVKLKGVKIGDPIRHDL